jgi:hypothetical protein
MAQPSSSSSSSSSSRRGGIEVYACVAPLWLQQLHSAADAPAATVAHPGGLPPPSCTVVGVDKTAAAAAVSSTDSNTTTTTSSSRDMVFACLRQQRAARCAAAITIQRHFRRWWAAHQAEQQRLVALAVQHRAQVLLRMAVTSWRGWVATRGRLAQLAVALYAALLPAAGLTAFTGAVCPCSSSNLGAAGLLSDSDSDTHSDSEDLDHSCSCSQGSTAGTHCTAPAAAATPAAAVHAAFYSRVKRLQCFLKLHNTPAAAAALRCEEGPWGLAAAHHRRRLMVKVLLGWSWAAAAGSAVEGR